MNKIKQFWDNHWFTSLIIFVVLFVLTLLFIDIKDELVKRTEIDSEQKATVQPIIDQKVNLVDSLLKIIVLQMQANNGSKQAIIVERGELQKGYQNALQISPEVCLPYINSIYKQANKLDSVNQIVIKRQDSSIINYSKTVSAYTDIMLLQKYQMQQKSDSISQLKEEKRLSAKKAKRQKIIETLKKVGTNILTFGAGYGTGKIIP